MMDREILTACAVMCVWLICDTQVKTGLFITFGLLLVACGFLAALDPQVILQRALSIGSWGVLLIGWGIFWHVRGRRIALDLASSWAWAHSTFHVLGIDRRESRRKEGAP